MHFAENKEKILTYMVNKGLCSREYAEHWVSHEQIPAFDHETPEHIIRTGQVNALLDYLEAATFEPKLKQEEVSEEDDYPVQIFGESLGMDNPDKSS